MFVISVTVYKIITHEIPDELDSNYDLENEDQGL